MPELTKQQTEALQALDWLLDPGDGPYPGAGSFPTVRGSGRTTVLALAYLRYAFNRIYGQRPPGNWVSVVDHHHTMGNTAHNTVWVLDKIGDLAHQAHLPIQIENGRFRILAMDPSQEDVEFARQFLFEEFVVDSSNEPDVPRHTSWDLILSDETV